MTDILTLADLGKLFLTLTASLTSPLIIVWANFFYKRNRELKEKQEYLWRSMHQSSQEYSVAFDKLDEIVDKLESGNPIIIGFYVPKSQIEFAERLAEIDSSKYSYIYSEFANRLQITQISFNLLIDLMKEICRTLLNQPIPTLNNPTSASQITHKNTNKKICSILRSRVDHVKEEILKLAKQELEVLYTLQDSSKQFKKNGDTQLLSKFEQTIKDLENKLNNSQTS